MSLYFAYGMNLDPRHMERVCPRAVALEPGRLRGYRFAVNRCGFATVLKDRQGEVHGMLWNLEAEHERTLDDFEGVGEGLYYRNHLWVDLCKSKARRRALIYIGADKHPGRPQPHYMDQILFGACHFGFPEEYLQVLAGWREPGKVV